MLDFQFADLHCHPNLKTYGHSFDDKAHNKKQDLWFVEKPSSLKKILKATAGITRFSQCDFSTMARGGSKLAVVSLYPFEKGFFINAAGKGAISAALSDMITGIGYARVRHIQQHRNYFEDLCREYDFFMAGNKEKQIGDTTYRWKPAANWHETSAILSRQNEIAVVLSIEGAHVFNTGLEGYGRSTDEDEVIRNVYRVKNWEYAPVFITFAHNFNNDLCGHSPSLDPLGTLVNQKKNLGKGFSPLGEKVLESLLDDRSGRRILIDLKHMSLSARKAYFAYMQVHDTQNNIPVVVSHGAVTGVGYSGKSALNHPANLFNLSEINFFDEEIVQIGRSKGLFAIQLDSRRIASREALSQISKNIFSPKIREQSARIVWNQIQHVAEVLDRDGQFAWGTACIGSDFDGTINPLNGILTTEDFPLMAKKLLHSASQYLHRKRLRLPENRMITPEEVVARFCMENVAHFLKINY